MADQLDMFEVVDDRDPEEVARDEAIQLFRDRDTRLVDVAFELARSLSQSRGRVSSPDVERVFKASPQLMEIAGATYPGRKVEWRFLGAVFRRKCWRKVGRETSGSHKREVPVWEYIDNDG